MPVKTEQHHAERSLQPADKDWSLTPEAAVGYMQQTFPHVDHWTYLRPQSRDLTALDSFLGQTYAVEGRIGGWRWRRMPTAYPRFVVWSQVARKRRYSEVWRGVVEVKAPNGRTFLIFAFPRQQDRGLCSQYVLSTDDRALVNAFVRALNGSFRRSRSGSIPVIVVNGPNLMVPKHEPNPVILPAGLAEDIDAQVTGFFESKAIFCRLGAPYHRGLLFVGPPGTGKTMTVRRLIRTCHARYRTKCFSLNITQTVGTIELDRLFAVAEDAAPAVVVLEDLDSLTNEAPITRSYLLSKLDGLQPSKGVLIIGSTNKPAAIDPAIIDRPSRFDRVYDFPLPSAEQRLRYLAHHFPETADAVINEIAAKTGNWSMAYMAELRTTASLLAARACSEVIEPQHLVEAHALLARQFTAGRRNHVSSSQNESLGFRVA